MVIFSFRVLWAFQKPKFRPSPPETGRLPIFVAMTTGKFDLEAFQFALTEALSRVRPCRLTLQFWCKTYASVQSMTPPQRSKVWR